MQYLRILAFLPKKVAKIFLYASLGPGARTQHSGALSGSKPKQKKKKKKSAAMRSTVLPSNTMGVVVACLLGSFLQNTVDASLLGKKDIVHRIQKVHVVEHAVLERRALTCPVDHYSCPDSLGGNCCPQRYGCATDSCFVTTAGTGMACGRRGYYNCPLEAGTGCCPEGKDEISLL